MHLYSIQRSTPFTSMYHGVISKVVVSMYVGVAS